MDPTEINQARRDPGGPTVDAPCIAVVIPAFRAEPYILGVISSIPEFVRFIVVVDDCSPDNTSAVVGEIADPRVCLVRHDANRGVGGATMTGYETALGLGADVIVKMDSDGQMDPAYLPSLLRPVLAGDADYSKGNRFAHARQLANMPPLRRLGNAGLSFLTKIASGYWNIYDPSNGYTAIHASVVSLLTEGQIDQRYFFETSVLIELGLLRAVVRDVYIPARYQNEVSSLSEMAVLRQFPARLIAAFVQRVVIQYFVRDFTSVSIYLIAGFLLALFGTGWGAYHWLVSISSGVPASTGTVMLSVLPLMLGIQFLLQAGNMDIINVPSVPLQKEPLFPWGRPAVGRDPK